MLMPSQAETFTPSPFNGLTTFKAFGKPFFSGAAAPPPLQELNRITEMATSKRFLWEANNRQVKRSNGERGDSLVLEIKKKNSFFIFH